MPSSLWIQSSDITISNNVQLHLFPEQFRPSPLTVRVKVLTSKSYFWISNSPAENLQTSEVLRKTFSKSSQSRGEQLVILTTSLLNKLPENLTTAYTPFFCRTSLHLITCRSLWINCKLYFESLQLWFQQWLTWNVLQIIEDYFLK